jgi:ribosomal protein S12 methylthiotransferase accessory factor YcaO
VKHQKLNSRKQMERKFDRKGVQQLSQVVTEEMTGMHAHLEAQKALIQAIIRVLDIDAKVLAQLDVDRKAEEQPEEVARVDA